MKNEAEVKELVSAALEAESEWRYEGPEGRRAAYDRFRALLDRIAELTGTTYQELFDEAIEEWVRIHFCSVAEGRHAPRIFSSAA